MAWPFRKQYSSLQNGLELNARFFCARLRKRDLCCVKLEVGRRKSGMLARAIIQLQNAWLARSPLFCIAHSGTLLHILSRSKMDVERVQNGSRGSQLDIRIYYPGYSANKKAATRVCTLKIVAGRPRAQADIFLFNIITALEAYRSRLHWHLLDIAVS